MTSITFRFNSASLYSWDDKATRNQFYVASRYCCNENSMCVCGFWWVWEAGGGGSHLTFTNRPRNTDFTPAAWAWCIYTVRQRARTACASSVVAPPFGRKCLYYRLNGRQPVRSHEIPLYYILVYFISVMLLWIIRNVYIIYNYVRLLLTLHVHSETHQRREVHLLSLLAMRMQG